MVFSIPTGKKEELLRSMASHVVITKEKALIQWIKPYSFTLEPDIIKHKKIVRTGPVRHARQDSNL